MDRLADAAFGAASPVTPKCIFPSDPAAQWTGAHKGHAFFAYATNYLIDTDHGVIVDVEATRAIRQAEVGASRTMLERTESRFGLRPDYVAADSAYGSADNLAWLVKEKKIEPHIPVFDKSNRTDGTFSRSDFTWGAEHERYICPAGNELKQFHRTYGTPRSGITAEGTRIYRASKKDCDVCDLKQRCCPTTPMRKVPRDLNEDPRDVARAIAATPEYELSRHRRKKVEMLFAHLKRILRMARLRLRGPCGAQDEFLLAATTKSKEIGQTQAANANTWRHCRMRAKCMETLRRSAGQKPIGTPPGKQNRRMSSQSSEVFNEIGRKRTPPP